MIAGERALGAAGAQPEVDLQPVSVLPCQFGDRLFGTARLQPEKRLQLAVLEDAIMTFYRLFGVDTARSRALFAEVEDWFGADEANGPFTFVAVCDTLNLDPDYIRGGLRRWRPPINPAAKRTPSFRRDGIGVRHRVVLRRVRRVA